MQLDWPPEVVNRLTEEARQKGLSLDAYVLRTVLQQQGSNDTTNDEGEKRRKRAGAGARILDIQRRVKTRSRRGIRRGRITKLDSQQFLISLNELHVRLSEPASYDDVFSLALEHGLTVYDAAYRTSRFRNVSRLQAWIASSSERPKWQAANSSGPLNDP